MESCEDCIILLGCKDYQIFLPMVLRQCGRKISAITSGHYFNRILGFQTEKLSILLSFYFHEVLQHLKNFIDTNFQIKRVLLFAIEDA